MSDLATIKKHRSALASVKSELVAAINSGDLKMVTPANRLAAIVDAIDDIAAYVSGDKPTKAKSNGRKA